MLAVTKPNREHPERSDTDMKKYAAVYALAMSCLDKERCSEIQQEILKVSVMCSEIQQGILKVSVMCVCPTIPRCNEKLLVSSGSSVYAKRSTLTFQKVVHTTGISL